MSTNPANISTIGVSGTDGVTPVYQPEARWCFWALSEIYNGTAGTNRYVPKLKDYVIDPDTFTTWIVSEIDPVTLIPTLTEIRPVNMSYSFSTTDILFGVGPGTQSDTYRVYVDASVTPSIMAVDVRLKVAGSMCNYCVIYKGSDLSSTGHILSKLYDASGNFVTNNIPLELVEIDTHTNYSVKTVSVCYTNETLTDGEVVTAVFYSAGGHVVSKRQLLVENTSFIRDVNASQKYVSSINLKSPFISPTFDNVINFPLNMPVNALNITGVVNYSDGSSLEMPVDGNKFKIFGLEQYVSTIVGQEINLVLSYALGANEIGYGLVSGDGKYATAGYKLVTSDVNNSYTVKLFGYPVWQNDTIGYYMQWYLFNLDRNVYFDVTPFVRFADNTGIFNPKGYGYMQQKDVTINLADVSGAFKPYIHTQTMDIVLKSPPNSLQTPWLVSSENTTISPYYGDKMLAIYNYNQMNSTINLNIAATQTTLDDWLNHIYYSTKPLTNPDIEIAPPVPTHFQIIQGGNEVEFTIDQWNASLNIPFVVALYSTVFVKFIKRTGNGDLELSIAGMLVTIP
jgi:hypothetical protein